MTRVDSADGSVGAAWVIGVETPYYAITDDAGRFRIDELAAGSYELIFWQAPIAHVVAGAWSYGAPTIVHRAVTVGGGHPASVAVALSLH